MIGVLIASHSAFADRVLPTPDVTSNFPDEIRLSSTTMEMYGALHKIAEEREKGSPNPEDLAQYTSAFEQLAQYRESIICRESVNPAACHTQNVAQKDELLNQVSSITPSNPGDYRKKGNFFTRTFSGFKKLIRKRIASWSAAYDKAVEQSKIASGSRQPAAEAIGVEYNEKDHTARLTGIPDGDRAPAAVTTAATLDTLGTASGAL